MMGIEKWSAIYQTMKENKLAILTLQETHLDNTQLLSLNDCFGKRLTIINSNLTENPRSSAGMAFVINHSLVAPKEMIKTELIQGRALAIKFKWHDDKDILLINVYAPNNRNDHPNFWEHIDTKRRTKGLRRPDLMLGNFNLTEELIDRTPLHLDDISAIAALRNLRQCLGIEDSWRHAFPHDRCFTYQANSNGQAIKSRLDRIYTSKEATKATYDWKIAQTSVPMDHWMVSTKYAPSHTPFIGKGRWTMQTPALKNDTLMKHVIDRGLALQEAIKNSDSTHQTGNNHAPQTLWANFKKDVVKITKKHSSESRGKLTKRMRDLEKEIKNLATNPDFDTDNRMRANETFLAKELETLKRIEARDKKDDLRAVITNHGEVLGGIWSAMNKDRKPRDLLYRLRAPDSPDNAPKFKRDTRRMAKLARDYHESLQSTNDNPDEALEWDRRAENALNKVKGHQRLSEQDINRTEWLITYPQVWNALKLAKTGTATVAQHKAQQTRSNAHLW